VLIVFPEEVGMKRTNAATVLAVTLTVTLSALAGTQMVLVDTSPRHNRHWSTVYTNEVSLRWEWPAETVSARLEIVGMAGTFTTDFSPATSNYLWRVFEGAAPTAEEAYGLTLTFLNASGGNAGALTARLAVISGTFGKVNVYTSPDNRKETQVKNNVVIPYDAAWTTATADAAVGRLVIAKEGGMTQTNALADSSGYYGWKLKGGGWGYGAFNLSLTFPETEGAWDAALTYVPAGTMISLR
jgi:hypothetical protein